MRLQPVRRYWVMLMLLAVASAPGFAATRHHKAHGQTASRKTAKAARVGKGRRAHTALAAAHSPSSHLSRLRRNRRRVIFNPWTEPTFADSTSGDSVDGEDLAVRRAAVQALGPFNGSVVVADPKTGRVMTIVNQKLAFKGGFQPCSTIKLVAAFAGLNEGLLDRNTLFRVGRRTSMDLTEALARSNNLFFATVGSRLGYDAVSRYAHQFGLGEKAGWNIAEEQAGGWPTAPGEGGMGMMTSFGSGIRLTPLELAAMVSSVANGGTLYYMQHPRTQEELAHLQPKVKRQLDIQRWIPEVKPGMMGAVEFGTARRANYSSNNQAIFGKTGTCSDERTPGIHLGWFGSFNEFGSSKLVVVVLLTGGRPINGPVASGVAGAVYKNLSEQGYFGPIETPLALVSTQTSFQ
jgi:penicillin-binding protein 2